MLTLQIEQITFSTLLFYATVSVILGVIFTSIILFLIGRIIKKSKRRFWKLFKIISVTFFIGFLCLLIFPIEANQKDVIIKTDYFIKNHAKDFLINDDLLKYSYKNRYQFSHNTKGDNYNVFIKNNKLRLSCYSDSCLIDKKQFGISKSLYLKKGYFYYLSKDTISQLINKDSTFYLFPHFDTHPINYFKKLKKDLKKYKIWSYSKTNKYISIPFAEKYILIFTFNNKPSVFYSKSKIIKDYKNGWFLIKLEQALGGF